METSRPNRTIPILSMAAELRSRLADRGCDRRADGLGIDRASIDGLCRCCRPAAAVWSPHPVCSLLLYAVLGTSRQLVVQSTSATAALIFSSVTAVLVAAGIATSAADIDPVVYQQYALAFAVVVGVVFLIAGLARLGFITQFLSKPVLDGFVTGLAVFVMVGQLYKLFGVPKTTGSTVEKFFETLRELPEANWVTFALGATALALLVRLPRWNARIPAGLIVLFGLDCREHGSQI